MIGKHVVIDTLDNFKTKLDLIPSSAIVLIKDVGQIYAHGTYFGAQKTYSLLTKTADGLAPKGGTSASSLIKDGESEWVLTVTNGENPSWRRLPDNAFNSLQYTLPSATTSELGGVKVGQVYTTSFDELVGQYYKINVDKNGLAYVNVPWVNTVFTASGNGITMKDNVFSLSLNSTSKLDSAIGDKIYAVSLDKNGKLCVSVPWVDTNNIFTGATETKNGSSGMVPAPIAKQHNYFLKGDGTWVKPNLSDFTDDVVSGKYLPLTGGELKGTTADVLYINTSVTDDVGIVFKLNGSINKGWVGYTSSIGTYLYNSTSKKYLGIKDDGSLYYSNGTIWHSNNDGSGSGLDADTIDGKHYSDIVNAIGTQLVKYNNSSEGFNQTSAYWVKVATVSPWNGSNRIDFKIEATTGSDSPLVTSFSILKSYNTTETNSYRGIYITQHDSSTYSSDIGNFNRVIVDASNNIWMYYGKVWTNLRHDILITCKSTYSNVKLLSLSEAKATITTTAPVPVSSTADFTFDGLYTVIKSKLGKITANVIKAISGFHKENSSDNYVLLGGGGHTLLSTIKELAAKIKINLSIDNDVEYPLIWSNQNNDTSEHSYLYKSFNLLSYNPKTNTIKAGTFSGNATSASKLNNSVNLWGIEFDGSSDVSGTLSQVNNIYGTEERAPYLYQSAVPTDSGNLGTAIGIGTAPNSYGIFMWGTGDGKGHIQVGRKDATKSSYQLCLLEFGGEVSIGNTATGHKLTVYGTIYGNQYNASGSLAGAALILNKGGDYFGFGPSGTAVSTMSFGSTDYYGKWKTEFMSIVTSGNVGIGKTDPTEKLHVNGNVLADQFIKSGGTSTQFLKADGSVDSTAYVSKSGDTITGKLTITNEGNEKLILNTTDPDNYNLIQFLKDGTSTGYIGTINNDFRIKFEDCPNFYYNGKIVLHLDNYSSYLGYIGTTPVQKDSAALGITGIVRISNKDGSNLYLGNSNNSAWVYTLDIASQSGISYWQIRTNGEAQFASTVTASGFVKKDSSDLYVLLGGGGSKSISSIQESSEKLKITQDNASNAQYPLIWTTENNSESNYSLVYKSYSQLTYNPKTDTLKATNFSGNATSANKLKLVALQANTDLNTLTEEGVYHQSNSTTINTFVNKPTTPSGGEIRLEVKLLGSSAHVCQLYYYKTYLGNNEIFYRVLYDKTWSAWEKLITSYNYNSYSPKLDGTGATGSWKIGLKGNSLDTKEKVDALLGKQFLVAYVLNNVLDDFNDGVILATGVGSTYGHHLYLDDNTLAIWHRSRNSEGTAWEAWRKLLDSVNYASYALPISGGTIDSKSTIPLIINSTSSNAVEIKLRHNKANKAAFLWDASIGVYMYSYVSNKYVSIKDDGTLTFNNKKIWHEDNDGADSGLDADKLDGLDGSYYTPLFNKTITNLTSANNLNDYTSGFYGYYNANNPTNSFGNNASILAFNGPRSTEKWQLAFCGNSGDVALRRIYSDKGWTNWKKLAFVDDVPTVTDYYWANVKIKSSEDKTTTPTFGGMSVTGESNLRKTIVVGTSVGETSINANLDALIVASATPRATASGTYYPGIALTHMWNYDSAKTYLKSPQAWIGTRLYSTQGSERSALVFATKGTTGTLDRPTERMCITYDGNVGIGTKSPSGLLHVNGVIKSVGTTNIYGSGSTVRTTINTSDGIGRIYTYDETNSVFKKLYVGTNDSSAIVVDTNNYVGIGNDTPSYKLDVSGTIKGTYLSSSNIRIECANDGTSGGCGSEINNFNDALYLLNHSTNNLYLASGGGNVGVGKYSADHKLDVNGTFNSDNYKVGGAIELKTDDAACQTTVFGSNNSGYRMRIVRQATANGLNTNYSPTLVLSSLDTHAYFAWNYGSSKAWIGAGSGNKWTWRSELITSDNIGSLQVDKSVKLYYSDTAHLGTKASLDGFLEAYTFKVRTWNGSNAEDSLGTSYPGARNGMILSGGWTSATYGFLLAIDDDPNWFMALRQRSSGTWSAWKRIPMGDGTGASGDWGINITGNASSSTITLRFKLLLTGSATTSKDLNTALSGGGIAANYTYPMSHASGFANAPSGSLYGCVILFSQVSDNLNGQLAWDVNHGGTDSTKSLWWRANDNTGFANAKWHQIAFTDTKVQNASNADVATKSNVIALTAADEDACVPSDFATMQHYRVSSSTTGGADGYMQSYVWKSGKYVTQIYYDVDSTNIMALRHRKNEGTWTSWMQICKSSTIRTLTVTSSPGTDANTIYFVT